MPFLTQGKTNWKYILIVLVLAIIVGGGILGWIKEGEISPPELLKIEKPVKVPEIEVEISPDLKSFQVKKEGKLVQIYTIQQWQEWAEKNWSNLRLEPVIMDELGVIGDQPDDFIKFISVFLSPNKSKIAFAVSSKEIALATFSMNGILNLETNEVNMIPNILWGDVEGYNWSPTGKHFAYTIGTARAEWDVLGVDDVLNKKNSFMLGGKEIGLILEEPSPVHFIPQFRNLKWSSNGNKLYFKTNDKGSQGEVEWVINVDGTDLKKVVKDETANWKTYRNEKYGFEVKYPQNTPCEFLKTDERSFSFGNIELVVEDSKGLSLTDYVSNFLNERHDWTIETKENTTIASKEAIKMSYRFGGTNRYGEITLVENNGKIYMIGYTAGAFACNEPEIFPQMLSTFTLY